jgi:predicted Zn-dependent protease
MLLGDIEAEWLEKTYNVIDDDTLTAHLDAIANRIVSQFPANPMSLRIILIDIPEVNSYSVAAGRIYITRRMVSLLQNDDELAGLLAHEIGHILTHQNAIVVTELFHDILRVNAVRDRQDILDKYIRVLDNMDRDRNVSRKIAARMQQQEEFNQYQADRVAFNSVAAAGFAPRAFLDLFDRSAQTHGRKGNFLTDFFQLTTPDERRLREIYKSLSLLPRPCREITPAAPSAEFLAWKAAVIAYPRLAGGYRSPFFPQSW